MSHSPKIMAIYGGTFDPFHSGHAAICDQVLTDPMIDQLRIVPCSVPALKSKAVTAANHRLTMLELWRQASVNAQRICVDDQELQRQGTSYTVDTITKLHHQYPTSKLIFVLGADAWNTLEQWHDYRLLASKVSFMVFTRHGEQEVKAIQGLSLCASKQALMNSRPGEYWIERTVDIPLSSSYLRQRNQVEGWSVPDVIKQYIKDHHLYQNEPDLLKVNP